MKAATYRTRIDLIVDLEGEWCVSDGRSGGAEFDVDSNRCPGLFLGGEPAEIVRHEELVRMLPGMKVLTEVWQRRNFSPEQIREIRYYRKGGPCDGDDTQRFVVAGRRG